MLRINRSVCDEIQSHIDCLPDDVTGCDGAVCVVAAGVKQFVLGPWRDHASGFLCYSDNHGRDGVFPGQTQAARPRFDLGHHPLYDLLL